MHYSSRPGSVYELNFSQPWNDAETANGECKRMVRLLIENFRKQL